MNVVIILFSAISFLAYGCGCFLSRYLASEFNRYGFSTQRNLIGILQILGAFGLVAGIWLHPIGQLASWGLSLMMLLAILIRIRIRDSIPQTIPAILYLVVNAYLALSAYP